MAKSYVRVRETIFDLYIERDQLSGLFRLVALISSWLILIGYAVFALAFSTSDEDLNASRNVLTALGSALLIVGYIAIVAVAFLGNSLLFLLDGALYPTLTSSLMGLVLTILTYSLHVRHPEPQVYVSIPLVTSCVTTVVALVVLVIIYREVSQIKRRDDRRRWHIAMGPYGGSGDTNSMISHQRSVSGPEDEAQRRQLMRLLSERREHPGIEETHGTFKIGLPGDQRQDTRGRSSSAPMSRGFNMTRLFPWTNTGKGTFKDARERRREEIERSTLPNSPIIHSRLQSRSRSASREPRADRGEPSASAAWGWPPATRYA